VFLAIGQIFGAFVLAISPLEPARIRLRWVAAGFLVFGVGALAYGYLYPLLVDSPHLTATMYGSLYVRTVGTALCAAGLALGNLPRIERTILILLTAAAILCGALLVPLADHLPPLIRISGTTEIIDHDPVIDATDPADHVHLSDLEALLSDTPRTVPGLTAWHWTLAIIPLVASLIAVLGTTLRAALRPIGAWLLLALALLAAAQLHSVFWPSMYSSILTTTSILRAGTALMVIIGGVLELRHIILQRDALLAAEQERTQRLEDLAALKADFTSIVAHELASPVAAIDTMSQMMSIDDLPPDLRRKTAEDIQAEARLLQMLVLDVRESANIERDDFRVVPRRLSLDTLVSEAESYARNLPGSHPVTIEHTAHTDVRGDPDRIGQVVRNLLNNAAKHTPDSTPIIIRTRREDSDVVIEVADRGPGIQPEDLGRIFEKFGRGREAARRHASGRGLGLYLSRRILHGHQTDLEVESRPGHGTAFRFRLREFV
ncbi:MAG TPA: HAMP domain-containing sensor histidine kinase, partial [Thermomicrobiales bacterium]|nr:HAMP domain-containing sensor histidine kinase [Thermomicrobiales bacterium]